MSTDVAGYSGVTVSGAGFTGSTPVAATSATRTAAGYTGVTADGAGFTAVVPASAADAPYAGLTASSAGGYAADVDSRGLVDARQQVVTPVSPYDGSLRAAALEAAPQAASTGYDETINSSEVVFEEGHTFVAPRQAPEGRLDHSYVMEWRLGPATSSATPATATAIMTNRPNNIFPFGVLSADGGPDVIRPGARLNLRGDTLWPFDDDHVVVTEGSETSFEFTAEPDHFRGGGSQVRFRVEQRDDQLYLVQEADEEGTVLAPLYDFGARRAWSVQAENLRRALYGGGTPSGFPWPKALQPRARTEPGGP
ncbi:hypothetical protein [Kribbella sp. CA-294648]|uniref:hypothetical protein n=1 Tax=Kribbella sp. CA-294648 TaxID=3239948 RepID=UPI003D948524